MFKNLKVLIWILCTLVTANAVAQEQYRIDEKSQKRSVCDMRVAKKSGLIVDVVEILQVPRFSRESNSRYNACPYTVTLKYHGIKIQIDFSDDPTLKQVKGFDDEPGTTLGFGVFDYDKNGWHASKGYYDSPNPKTTVQNSENSVFVVGEWGRKDGHSKLLKSCIDFLVVGNERWAIGGVCSPQKNSLAPLKSLFNGEPVLSFDTK